MPIRQDTTIGVTVFLPHCSFQAELSRLDIPKTLAAIEEALSQSGLARRNTTKRISAAVSRSVKASRMVSTGEMSQEDGISEIGYTFLYVYVLEQGAESLQAVRGLIGCLTGNKLYLNPCTDSKSYEKAAEAMRKIAPDVMGYDTDEMRDETPKKPTIH